MKYCVICIILVLVLISTWYVRGKYDKLNQELNIKGGYVHLYMCMDAVNNYVLDKGMLPASIKEAILYYKRNRKMDFSWMDKVKIKYYTIGGRDARNPYCIIMDIGQSPYRVTMVGMDDSYRDKKSGEVMGAAWVHADGMDFKR